MHALATVDEESVNYKYVKIAVELDEKLLEKFGLVNDSYNSLDIRVFYTAPESHSTPQKHPPILWNKYAAPESLAVYIFA